jgi:hypothetical protein
MVLEMHTTNIIGGFIEVVYVWIEPKILLSNTMGVRAMVQF